MYEYKKRPSKLKKVFILILLMAVVSATSIYIYSIYTKIDISQYSSSSQVSRLSTNQEQTNKSNNKTDVTQVLSNVTKCVVGISKIKNNGNSIFLNNSTSDLGLGTGVIVSDKGYIVTNWHVAGDKYSSCYITLESGDTYNGSVVWADSDLDLAIVKISGAVLNCITLGDSDNIKVGENVYAVGNPVGVEFQRTVTKGIISGLDRTIKIEETDKVSYMEDLIQTDATINPGNSRRTFNK